MLLMELRLDLEIQARFYLLRPRSHVRIVLGRPILEGTAYSLALIDLLALVRFVLVLGV